MSELKVVAALTQIPGVAQNYLPQDAKPEALRLANVALPRYKIGFGSDEWGWRDSTPSGIPSPDGAWVRFEDAQVLQTGYASARLEIESLKARAQELVAQLDAVGAGGVEPLRKRECLHKIAEPQPAANFGRWIFRCDDVRDIIDVTEPNGTRHTLAKSILAKHKQIVGLFEAMRRGLLRQPVPQSPEKTTRASEVYRHKKTGGIYEAICNAYMEKTGELVVVYRNEKTGERWVRPAVEFNDGRFERVGPADHFRGIKKMPPIEVQRLPADDTEGGAV